MNESQRNGNRGLLAVVLTSVSVALLAVGMLLGSLFTSPARAAGPGPVTTAPDQTITVSGQGEVHLQPDMAQLNFNIHQPGATADAALTAYNTAEQALLAALQAQGLGDKDVVVNPPAVWPAPPDNNSPVAVPSAPGSAAPTGYYADGTITVTVHDLSKLRDLATAGVKAADGIGLGGVQWGLQNDKDARNTAMQQAIDNARAQADAVAAKLGLTVKSVAGVTVQPNYNTPGPWMAAGKGVDGAPAPAGEASLAQLGSRPDMVITMQVQVSYNFQ